MNTFSQIDAYDQQHMRLRGVTPIQNHISPRCSVLKSQLWDFRSELSRPLNRYLIKGWLDRGAFSVVYGESNVGKSFFALDLALHIASGTDWHGARTSDVSKVLYIAAEGGQGMLDRAKALKMSSPELISICDIHQSFSFLSVALDLCGAEDPTALSQLIGSPQDYEFVIVDTLARSMGNGDENAAKDMNTLVRNLDFIREQSGCHVMLIHHSGKDSSKGARGSSVLRAAVDTEIEITRSGQVIQAETRKQRDMRSGSVFAYTLEDVLLGKDEDDDDITSAIVVPTDPVKPQPKLSSQQTIGLQALDDALAKKGEVLRGDMFPQNRRCVSEEVWKDFCDRHSLSSGESASARRKAFHTVKSALHEKEIIRIIDGYIWRCSE